MSRGLGALRQRRGAGSRPPREPAPQRLGWLLLAAVISVIVVSARDEIGSWFDSPHSLAAQIEQLEARAAASNSYLQIREAPLRGPGLQSLIVDSTDVSSLTGDQTYRSDAFTIYDVVGPSGDARLVKRFSFVPDDYVVSGNHVAWRVEIQKIGDLRGDGEQEIIGALRLRSGAHPFNLPVMIRRNSRDGRYQLVSLVTHRPPLAGAPWDAWASTYRLTDLVRVTVRDHRSRAMVSGFSVQYYAVEGTPAGVKTVGVIPYRGTHRFPDPEWQLVGSQTDLLEAAPFNGQCELLPGNRRPTVRLTLAAMTEGNILAAWRRGGNC